MLLNDTTHVAESGWASSGCQCSDHDLHFSRPAGAGIVIVIPEKGILASILLGAMLLRLSRGPKALTVQP